MKITIVNDAEGCPAVSVVDDSGATVQSVELAREQSVTVEVDGAASVTLGEVSASAEPESPADPA